MVNLSVRRLGSAKQRRPGLEIVDISRIRPNQINPRGPDVRANDPHREELKESIREFGILVHCPEYWIAKSLKIQRVPALIVDGHLDKAGVLQRMFQIHMNRDQWDAVQLGPFFVCGKAGSWE